MYEELGEVGEVLVDELKSFGVVARQLDLLPPLGRQMRALNGFDVEEETARRGIRADGGVSRVCERTCLATAVARDVVFVATKGLVLVKVSTASVEKLCIFVPLWSSA